MRALERGKEFWSGRIGSIEEMGVFIGEVFRFRYVLCT